MISYRELEKLDARRLKNWRDEKFCVIDFETNGGYGSDCEVIEFAAVKVERGELTTNVASLCAPSAPLSRFITDLTGISTEMTTGYPPFENFLRGFVDYIGDAIIVAHNAPFDVGILLGYCARAGIDLRPRVLCTLQNSRRLFPDFPNHKLGTLGEIMDLFDGRAHRALADSLATARLLLKMFEFVEFGTF